jgi:3-hydroxybutyryl-CoA dehydrogenase
MDLIGHDTNYAVTNSVFEANFWDRRFTPSLVQRELVEGGLLGRKSGRGFYAYPAGAPALPEQVYTRPAGSVVVHGRHERLVAAFPDAEQRPDSDWTGLAIGNAQLRLTDGRSAHQLAAELRVQDLAVFDELPASGACAYTMIGHTTWAAEAPAWLACLGVQPQLVADVPGLVVARTLAMLVNEAADAVLQGVCTTEGADAAMKLGVNYPAGPFEWYRRLGRRRIVGLIEALDREYRGERYRVSPWLRRSV